MRVCARADASMPYSDCYRFDRVVYTENIYVPALLPVNPRGNYTEVIRRLYGGYITP